MLLTSAEPQLFVSDVRASCAFFTSKLAFAVSFVYGDPPFYAQVRRDDAKLNMRLLKEPVFAGDVREREHLLAATITVKSSKKILRLFEEVRSAGVTFAQLPRKEPWGASTFIVVDPDGNLLLFAGPAE